MNVKAFSLVSILALGILVAGCSKGEEDASANAVTNAGPVQTATGPTVGGTSGGAGGPGGGVAAKPTDFVDAPK